MFNTSKMDGHVGVYAHTRVSRALRELRDPSGNVYST